MKHKLMKALAVAAFASLAFTPVAQSAQVNVLFQPGINTIQDTDAERVLRQGTPVTSGAFLVGDVIESIFRFDTVNAQTIADTLPAPYQLTGYSQLLITAITPLGPPGAVRLTFGATGALGPNVLVELRERTSAAQPSNNFGAAPATGIANVLAHTLIAEFGLGEADDFWFSDQINDIGVVAAAAPGSGQAAAGVFGISVLTNDGGLPIGKNAILSPIDLNLHDVVGDASVFARETGVNTGWLVSSNINASFNNVPEPGTMVLLGVALLGLGVTFRPRKG